MYSMFASLEKMDAQRHMLVREKMLSGSLQSLFTFLGHMKTSSIVNYKCVEYNKGIGICRVQCVQPLSCIRMWCLLFVWDIFVDCNHSSAGLLLPVLVQPLCVGARPQ